MNVIAETNRIDIEHKLRFKWEITVMRNVIERYENENVSES